VLPEEYYKQYLGKPGVKDDTAKFLGMLENIDTNFGKLLAQLKEWGIEDNTLVIYFTGDNGGTSGRAIFDAGLHGGKGTSYQGGTRATTFFRWPGGKVPAGMECDALSAHLDLFPTFAELTGASLSAEVKQQVEGRSLLPLLSNPKAEWPDRTLVHHVGRWGKGQAAESKYRNCSIQNSRFTLVSNKELYDLKADPGEETNVIAAHPEIVAKLRASYDQWWTDVQPLLVNEAPTNIAKINPFQELYYKQFGGSPTPADLKRMDPATRGAAPEEKAAESTDESPAAKRRQRKKAKEAAPDPVK
jgi:arylsulfatase A-like enzyme